MGGGSRTRGGRGWSLHDRRFPGADPRTAAQCLNGQMEAMDWLREQGVVLQSARGPVPNLAEQVAGERIRGSWWGPPVRP